jgi:hypothetical protein
LNFLLQPDFDALRSCLCQNKAEWQHFEDLIRSIVLATDIMDKELKADRNSRWDKVFGSTTLDSSEATDRLKATIVLEQYVTGFNPADCRSSWSTAIIGSQLR